MLPPGNPRKRARLDNEEKQEQAAVDAELPPLLVGIGLLPNQTRKLMQWMLNQDLCFSACSIGGHGSAQRFMHIVQPELAIGKDGELDDVVCLDCCEYCPCCDRPCNYFYSTEDDLDCPHSRLCFECQGKNCEHPFPETCPICGKGRRVIHERDGIEYCEECDEDDVLKRYKEQQ